MKGKKTGNIIPIGIFSFIFIFMVLVSIVISIGYYYFEVRSRITEIETFTRNYSIPLAEAFANIAELNYEDKDFTRLKVIFREKIQANIIDEAFFVLSNGKIIVHSDKEKERELKGNIAADEFAYNIDLIMLPIWTKTDHVQFLDYHIYDNNKRLPFNRDITKLLKKYIYNKIDVLGWLVTRAVIYKGKGVGCVSFLISKDRIYKTLTEHFGYAIRLSAILSIISFIVSFLISLAVFFRYRSMRIKRFKFQGSEAEVIGTKKTDIAEIKRLKEPIRIKHTSIQNKISSGKKKIKDAISVKGK